MESAMKANDIAALIDRGKGLTRRQRAQLMLVLVDGNAASPYAKES